MDKKRLEKLNELCIKKIEKNMSIMEENLREYTAKEDGYYFSELEIDNPENPSRDISHLFVWTPSFFTGMACLAYENTKDPSFVKWLNQFYDGYHNKVFNTPMNTMHDLGFLYSLYSVALYKLTGDVNHKKVGIKAAEELAKRFFPKGNYIRAWGRLDEKVPDYVSEELAKDHFFTESKGLAIIDCMMNIPLLYWATEVTGNPYFRNIANAHADMTMERFIREDNTVFHAYRFDEATGNPIGGTNYCGYSDDSYWSRGAAWAIYGYIIAYGYTQDETYLETSKKLAHKYIDAIQETIVPVWDFSLPEGAPREEDTSAAAIAACAFIEIAKHDPAEKELIKWADKTIEALAGDKYLNKDIECPGILRHSSGTKGYWICSDYFFMELINKRLHDIDIYW